jgi:hypothetical protein
MKVYVTITRTIAVDLNTFLDGMVRRYDANRGALLEFLEETCIKQGESSMSVHDGQPSRNVFENAFSWVRDQAGLVKRRVGKR